MKYLSILLLIVLLLVLTSCATTQQSIQNQNNNIQTTLHPSFTINFYQDSTSSGGSRYYNASLSFQDNKLTSGWQRYENWPGTGGHNIYECVIDVASLNWVDKATKGVCTLNFTYIPLTKQGIQDKINSKEIVLPSDNYCPHLAICYEVLNNNL